MTGQPSVSEVRAAIDETDRDLIVRLANRQRLVERAGQLKRGQDAGAVRAPSWVEAVICARRASSVEAGLDPDVAELIWRSMIAAFIDLELRVHSGIETPIP